jgi:hypothetical protein
VNYLEKTHAKNYSHPKPRKFRASRTARIKQLRQDNRKDSQDRTSNIGQTGRNNQERTTNTVNDDSTARKESQDRGIQERKALTGQPGKMARTERPGQDSQNMEYRTRWQ